MRIALRFVDDTAVMSLSGKFLAGSDGPYLRQKVNDLIAAGATKLLLNFAEVPYIDSTGLGFLAGAREAAQRANLSLVLASLNQHVRKILDEVQLTQFFVITKDEVSGLAKLAKVAAGKVRPAPEPPEGPQPRKTAHSGGKTEGSE